MDGLLIQLLNGLASTSTLFLASLGLTLIFGVCRIVNFAHGSFYMLGLYLAYQFSTSWGHQAFGFWGSILVAAVLVGLLGALIEVLVLRRLYKLPELLQLLATFALLLIISDIVLWYWGPDDLLGPLAPGLDGVVTIVGHAFPEYDLFLMVMGPLVLLLIWALLRYTRFGLLVRAATYDREMLAALGVNQAWLFTGVFALGSFLAAFAAGLELPREPASLLIDLNIIGDLFAVVVIGGMGSIPGAFLAALLISQIKALCIWLGSQTLFGVTIEFSQLTLVAQFLLMALVLMVRPWGLLGRPVTLAPRALHGEPQLRPALPWQRVVALVVVLCLATFPLLQDHWPYLMYIMQDALLMVLFATSLYFIVGPAGMSSFGHAAYFGVGAYTAAFLAVQWGWSMGLVLLVGPLGGLVAAMVFGWFSVRLTGIYMAMLTLAFAQFVWSIIFQWDGVTGGSNGMFGVWPEGLLAMPEALYYAILAVVVLGVVAIRYLLFSHLGYCMRATRDAPLRAEALGISVRRVQWQAFVVAGFFASIAGVWFVYAKGSVSPDELTVGRSVDGLVMVLLGGIQSTIGPLLGAVAYVFLHDWATTISQYWKALLGVIILFLVLLLPGGLVSLTQWFRRGEVTEPVQPAIEDQAPTTPEAVKEQALNASATEPSSEVLLKATNISKRYGGFWALNDTSFALHRGEMVALIGPNGAGKSTVFNLLGGQFQPTGGTIYFKDKTIHTMGAVGIWRSGIGRTFQLASVFNSLSVLENAQLALKQARRAGLIAAPESSRSGQNQALALLQQVGLASQAERTASDLAYGDVKRLELALALAHDPALLLMDEPTAGVPPTQRHELMQLVQQLSQQRQMAVLFTEHSMDVVFHYAQRVLVMSEGRLVAQGSPQQMAQDPQVQRIYLGTRQLMRGGGSDHG